MNEIILKLEEFSLSNETQVTLPPLTYEDRLLVHAWCEKNNYHSSSKGQQPNRYMIIDKKERKFSVKDCDIDYFIKEYNLPIPIRKSPYFEYFLDLYEKDYFSRTKYNKFLESLKAISSLGYTLNSYRKYLLDKIVEHIKSTDAYKQFLKDDIKSTSIDKPNTDVYKTELTQYYISVDIKKANFTSLTHFYPKISFVNDKINDSWEEFIRNFTNVEFFIESKPFRQIIFGHLNCKKNSLLWKGMCCNMLDLLTKTSLNVVGKVSDDELIIMTTKENMETDLNIINKLLNVENSCSTYWKVTPFYVKYIARNDSYQKIHGKFCYYTNRCEIKGCDKHFFAQLYKTYNNIPLCDIDFKTSIGDAIVTFDDPCKFTLI